jgi:hypothetical protein
MTKTVRFFLNDNWQAISFFCLRKFNVALEIELNYGEKYVFWPANSLKSSSLKGSVLEFQRISTRSLYTVRASCRKSDGTPVTVDLSDLVTEEQYKMLEALIAESDQKSPKNETRDYPYTR